MIPLLKFLAVLLSSYLLSRAALRLRYNRRPLPLVAAHALVFLLIVGVLMVIKLPLGLFSAQAIGLPLIAQLVWLTVDGAWQAEQRQRRKS